MAWLGLDFDQVFVFFCLAGAKSTEDTEDYYRLFTGITLVVDLVDVENSVQRGSVDLLSLFLLDCYSFKLASTCHSSHRLHCSLRLHAIWIYLGEGQREA